MPKARNRTPKTTNLRTGRCERAGGAGGAGDGGGTYVITTLPCVKCGVQEGSCCCLNRELFLFGAASVSSAIGGLTCVPAFPTHTGSTCPRVAPHWSLRSSAGRHGRNVHTY